ncbi:MAG: chemotaxis protein CheA [Nitrospirota bacterium]|nr:chemotaxis protein CheA [Nitrospirota bacterium]
MKTDRPIQEFLAESEDILETATGIILSLEDGLEAGRTDPDQVNALFRALHSFKGLAGMFGLQQPADLAHKLEFLLDEIRLGKVALVRENLNALSDVLGTLGRLVRQIGKGEETEGIAGALATLDRILAAKPGAGGEKSQLSRFTIDPAVLQVLTEYEEHRLKENIREGKNLFLVRAAFSFAEFETGIRSLTESIKKQGEIICTLPTAGSGDGIGFTIMVGSAGSREDLAAVFGRPNIQVEEVPRAAEEPAAEPRAETATLKTVSNTVRVDIHKLDSLMSVVGELHIVKGEIGGIASDLRAMQGFTGLAVNLFKAYKNLERRLNEIQEGILDVRMVPIGQIFTRLSTVVRKYARDAGKEIDLEIRGEETELDKLMVEDLADPLMHLVRNAIDHGIDRPDVRRSIGKPESGLVRLTAFPKGNHVVITVEDDGRGIDPDVILAKAREKGLVEPGDDLDPDRDRKEILDLIFLPGFTTSEKVTEISGRGVGMDVVKRNVSRLSGMIDIDTEPGEGTVFTLTMPITLAIIKALIIETGGRRFAVPLGSVLEILRVRPEQIETVETREVMAIRDETVPLLRLVDAFGLTPDPSKENLFVILVGLAERRLGIVVEGLQGQQEIVIKPLGKRLADTPGIAGATELGDKRIVLVLDVESLIEGAMRKTVARNL